MSTTNAVTPITLTDAILNGWANDPKGPVALHLKQKLLPVEGEGGVIFPPTYADIGYNIDTLSDGTKVATIDSVGSQANRMEPMFKAGEFKNLVPQIEITLSEKTTKDEPSIAVTRSIFDLAHRSADAVVKASPTLEKLITPAFQELRNGNAGRLCAIAPTSLIFGVWDSRGGSSEKRPRLVRSLIRGLDVEPLSSAAQFNSIWKQLSERQQEELTAEATKKKVKLSNQGFADAPATFRKLGKDAAAKIPMFRDGAPNPERRVLGGIVARGCIERTVTINLIALRAICGSLTSKESEVNDVDIRRYLLSLALIAATTDQDLYLREGCQLRYGSEDIWHEVPRRGELVSIDLSSDAAQKTISDYAAAQAKKFKAHWPEKLEHNFDLAAAKKMLSKTVELDEPDA
jgi:CRISPR-associated protein Csb1